MSKPKQTGSEIDAYYQEKLAKLDTMNLCRYDRWVASRMLFDMWRTELESFQQNRVVTGLDISPFSDDDSMSSRT